MEGEAGGVVNGSQSLRNALFVLETDLKRLGANLQSFLLTYLNRY